MDIGQAVKALKNGLKINQNQFGHRKYYKYIYMNNEGRLVKVANNGKEKFWEPFDTELLRTDFYIVEENE